MPPRLCVLVEDDGPVRSYIRTVLEGRFDVVEAPDGLQALTLIRALGSAVTLLLSDIDMPKMDGIELAAHVRRDLPAVSIVLFSGAGDYDDAVGSRSFPFLSKPFGPAALLETISAALEGRGAS